VGDFLFFIYYLFDDRRRRMVARDASTLQDREARAAGTGRRGPPAQGGARCSAPLLAQLACVRRLAAQVCAHRAPPRRCSLASILLGPVSMLPGSVAPT
jgi:hypothetical protein